MGILSRIEHPRLRANTPGVMEDYWYGDVGGRATYAGLSVTPDVAMRVSVVHACVEVLSMTLAALPLVLYRRLADGGKEKALEHPLYPVIGRRPNSWQSRFEFVEYLVRQLFLRGGGYAEKDLRARELVPVHPDRIKIEQLATHRLRYRISPPIGTAYTRSQDEMLHVRDAGDDAVAGQARTVLAREAIAVAAAAERFSGRWLQNDGSGRVIMTHPAKLDPTTRAEIHRLWQENQAGWANRGKALLAEGGVKYEVLPSLAESGFLVDPRKFQLAEICRYFGRVPPFMIGHEDRTTWGTNIEQIKGGFVAFCAQPVGTRLEQAMMRDLLDEDEQDDYFIAFEYAELLRGDLLSVVQAIAIQRQQGLLSPNEGRALLNRNPRTDPGGEQYQDTPTGAAPNNPQRRVSDPPSPDAPEPAPGAPDEPAAGIIPAPLLADAVQRIAHAETAEIQKRQTKASDNGTKWAAWVRSYYASHRLYALKVLAPLGEAYGIPAWVVDVAAQRIERTAVVALETGVPEGWLDRRAPELARLVEETLRAGAVVSIDDKLIAVIEHHATALAQAAQPIPAPSVTIEPAQVHVAAPQVHVAAPHVELRPSDITVHAHLPLPKTGEQRVTIRKEGEGFVVTKTPAKD